MLNGIVQAFKPLILFWAGLNAIDDFGLLLRAARLAAVILPGSDKDDLCNVCDDVMGDLLKGADGLDAIPCSWACLRLPPCMRMCETLKAASSNSSHFPCIAAGYCNPIEEGAVDADVECSVAFPLRCVPARYCQRHRNGLRMSCKLRPGIGRWVGMRNAVGSHAAALADGLLSQPHCGQPGAGPYCIATPTGLGAAAEGLGHIISVLYGGLRTVQSIETDGGDDDRQWLTFWLILTLLLFIERFLARVVLSTFPMYYEAKFCLLCWLMFFDGAEKTYRKYRRALRSALGHRLFTGLLETLGLHNVHDEAQADKLLLDELKREYPEVVEAALEAEAKRIASSPSRTRAAERHYKELDPHELEAHPSATRHLHVVYSFVLTPEGTALLASEGQAAKETGLLIERAAARLSFQPRVLNIDLLGVADEPDAAFPPMDANGSVDPYVVFQLVPSLEASTIANAVASADAKKAGAKSAVAAATSATATARQRRRVLEKQKPYPEPGLRSSTKYHTVRPAWDQSLELTLRGGAIDHDGYHRSGATAAGTSLLVHAYDADIGYWGWLLGASTWGCCALAAAVVSGHILGLTDNMAEWQQSVFAGVAISTATLLGAAMLNSWHLRSEDDLIGSVTVPLKALMDQETHTYVLEFFPPHGKANAQPAEPSSARKSIVFRRAGPGLKPVGLRFEDDPSIAGAFKVRVSHVQPESQAASAGVPAGAVVVSMNGISMAGKTEADASANLSAAAVRPLTLVYDTPHVEAPPSAAGSRVSRTTNYYGGVGKIVVQLTYSER